MRSLLAITAASILTLAALTGCGGSDSSSGQSTTDVAPTFSVNTQQAAPIVHTFTEAGTYTLDLKGDYAPTGGSSDTLDVWFSFSGQGSIVSGDAEPVYAIQSGNASTRVDQSITVTLTGQGPWQLQVLCGTAFASGTMTNLTLTAGKH